jgi:hypothetical protein
MRSASGRKPYRAITSKAALLWLMNEVGAGDGIGREAFADLLTKTGARGPGRYGFREPS